MGVTIEPLASEFDIWDIDRLECVDVNRNHLAIQGVAPGAKIGVVDTNARELLLYGEADGLGCFEGDVPVPDGDRRMVRIRVRWPQDPPVEVETFVGMPLDRTWSKKEWEVPVEDWMERLYG